MNVTKRGRGQRRNRRTKNVSMDPAVKRAWQHIKFNMDTYGNRIAEVLPDITNYFRSLNRR